MTHLQTIQVKHWPDVESVLIPYTISDFKFYLTLFSKSFSPFPYGTCELSVSHRYLALDGIHHPFQDALPSIPTLGERFVRGGLSDQDGVLTLSDGCIPTDLVRGQHTETASTDHNSQKHKVLEIQFGLFPFHSPLLGESCLVSFPPLTDMLKFSGCSYLPEILWSMFVIL